MESANVWDAILIAGPTASGKSAKAIELALQHGGEIINADSMQIYPVLNVLTARPDREDLLKVLHHLYGYAPLNEAYSVARWLEDARRTTQDVRSRGKIPVFVGGTGLYFRAIENGLAKTPEVPSDIRAAIRGELTASGSEKMHARLAEVDPDGAERLRPGDSHRIARALEVITATGKPLSWFQEQMDQGALNLGENVLRLVIMPPRNVLHERINARAEVMFEHGAVGEVRQLLDQNLPAESTAMRAIGVPQVQKYIHGEYSLNECLESLKTATRQYAKRQSTWFRGQFNDKWTFVEG